MTVKELLKEFADEVHKGKYERLPYKDWSEIRKYDNNQYIITRGHGINEYSLYAKDSQGRKTKIWTNENKPSFRLIKSFGQFLDKKWIDDSSSQFVEFKIDNDMLSSVVELNQPITTYNTPNKNNIIIKENKSMKNTFNFNFGPCTNNDNIHLSPYGIAVKNSAGTWVSYNTKDASIIDVDIFNFNASKYLFKMPVALKDIKVGDVLIHNNKPVFVLNTEKGIYVVDPTAGEKKEILLTKNMFGFDFATKVISLFSAFDTAPTTDSPFGNMLPFLMMGEGGSEDIDPFVMYMMMQQTGGSMNNPMMLYFLMNRNNDSSNLLPLMFMMNNNNSNSLA